MDMLLNRFCPTLDPDRGTQQKSCWGKTKKKKKDQEGDQQQTASGPWLNVIPSDTMRCYDVLFWIENTQPKKGLTSTADTCSVIGELFAQKT